MKTRNKRYDKSRLRLLCLLTALLGIFGAGQTWAANPTTLTVGGTNVLDGGYWKTNADGTLTADGASAEDYNVYYDGNGTLTLNNANITGTSSTTYGAAICAEGGLTIELEGSSTATGVVPSGNASLSGLYVSGTLTISGEGSLTVSTADATDSRQSYGIYVYGTYIQNGGSITSRSGTGTASRGVYARLGMTVNGGSLTATGGTATSQDSSGINVTGTITVGSATVNATGNSYGIYSNLGGGTNSLTVTGGKVTATGNSFPIYIETYLLFDSSANNHVSVTVSNSGSITAQSGAGIVLKSSQVGMSGTDTGTGSMTVESGSTLLANSVTLNDSPLAPTGEGSWLIYGQSGQTSPMHGNVTLPADLTIESGNTFTIPAGSTLTVPEGVKLTVDGTLANQGTLAIANENSLKGSGTLSGDDIFVATAVTDVTDIVVPEGVTCADYREKVALGGPTVLGVPFLANAEGWTLSFEPGVCTPNGRTYTATATNGSKTFSQTFTALHSFDAEGSCACGVSLPQTDAEGRYLLADAFQLRWFAALVNGTLTNGTAQNAAANAVLTKDIALTGEDWTPIGNASTIYTGTFDGQGYTISGMKIDNADGYSGLFGNVTGTVRNFTVTGSIAISSDATGLKVGGAVGSLGTASAGGTVSGVTSDVDITVTSGSGHIGGVVGSLPENSSPTVESCVYTGTLTSSVDADCVAGVVGYIRTGTIKNCANRGQVSVSGSGNVGGVLGYCNNKGITISNCYNTGSITGSGAGTVDAIVGNNNGTQATVSSCYYLTDSAAKGQGQLTGDAAGTVVKTADDFKSGAVAVLLQGDQTEQAWGQALGTDNYPVPTTDEAMRVYAAKQYNGSADNVTDVYANASGISLPENALLVIESAVSTPTGTNVVVKDGDAYTCANLVLTDGADFYTPYDFTAAQATYTRQPQVYADGSKGWETLCLPFGGQLRVDSELLTPVTTGAEGGYWLRRLTGVSGTTLLFSSYETDASIEAGVSYIIALPGSEFGSESLEGKAFSVVGTDVTVSMTTNRATADTYTFVGAYASTPVATGSSYLLNAGGDLFELQAADATTSAPFRAYITADAQASTRGTGSLPPCLSIGNGDGTLTGIENAPATDADELRVYGAADRLVIRTSRPLGVTVCNMQGQLLWRGTVDGERTLELESGVYIVNGKKGMVR